MPYSEALPSKLHWRLSGQQDPPHGCLYTTKFKAAASFLSQNTQEEQELEEGDKKVNKFCTLSGIIFYYLSEEVVINKPHSQGAI